MPYGVSVHSPIDPMANAEGNAARTLRSARSGSGRTTRSSRRPAPYAPTATPNEPPSQVPANLFELALHQAQSMHGVDVDQNADANIPESVFGFPTNHAPTTASTPTVAGNVAAVTPADAAPSSSSTNPNLPLPRTHADAHQATSTPSASAKPKVSHARKRAPGHVPRPRNAFILFRSHAVAQNLIPRTVEKDHRNISRIVSHMWKSLAPYERSMWELEAQREKEEHRRQYPDYKYQPELRRDNVAKRNLKQEEGTEKQCVEIADLILKLYGRDGVKQGEAEEQDGQPPLQSQSQHLGAKLSSSSFGATSTSAQPAAHPPPSGAKARKSRSKLSRAGLSRSNSSRTSEGAPSRASRSSAERVTPTVTAAGDVAMAPPPGPSSVGPARVGHEVGVPSLIKRRRSSSVPHLSVSTDTGSTARASPSNHHHHYLQQPQHHRHHHQQFTVPSVAPAAATTLAPPAQPATSVVSPARALFGDWQERLRMAAHDLMSCEPSSEVGHADGGGGGGGRGGGRGGFFGSPTPPTPTLLAAPKSGGLSQTLRRKPRPARFDFSSLSSLAGYELASPRTQVPGGGGGGGGSGTTGASSTTSQQPPAISATHVAVTPRHFSFGSAAAGALAPAPSGSLARPRTAEGATPLSASFRAAATAGFHWDGVPTEVDVSSAAAAAAAGGAIATPSPFSAAFGELRRGSSTGWQSWARGAAADVSLPVVRPRTSFWGANGGDVVLGAGAGPHDTALEASFPLAARRSSLEWSLASTSTNSSTSVPSSLPRSRRPSFATVAAGLRAHPYASSTPRPSVVAAVDNLFAQAAAQAAAHDDSELPTWTLGGVADPGALAEAEMLGHMQTPLPMPSDVVVGGDGNGDGDGTGQGRLENPHAAVSQHSQDHRASFSQIFAYAPPDGTPDMPTGFNAEPRQGQHGPGGGEARRSANVGDAMYGVDVDGGMSLVGGAGDVMPFSMIFDGVHPSSSPGAAPASASSPSASSPSASASSASPWSSSDGPSTLSAARGATVGDANLEFEHAVQMVLLPAPPPASREQQPQSAPTFGGDVEGSYGTTAPSCFARRRSSHGSLSAAASAATATSANMADRYAPSSSSARPEFPADVPTGVALPLGESSGGGGRGPVGGGVEGETATRDASTQLLRKWRQSFSLAEQGSGGGGARGQT